MEIQGKSWELLEMGEMLESAKMNPRILTEPPDKTIWISAGYFIFS